jgi:hypothetical protein
MWTVTLTNQSQSRGQVILHRRPARRSGETAREVNEPELGVTLTRHSVVLHLVP